MARIIITLIALVAVGGGIYAWSQGGESGTMMKEDAPEAEAMMEKDGEAMTEKKDDAMMEGEDTMKAEASSYMGMTLAGTASPLLDFTKADYDKALARGMSVALYFYADWCPICKAEFPVMQEAFDALDSDGVVGFRVNYKDDFTDADEVALAREFGIAYQHTKVLLKGGEQVLKSPESWDRARYDAELAKLAN